MESTVASSLSMENDEITLNIRFKKSGVYHIKAKVEDVEQELFSESRILSKSVERDEEVVMQFNGPSAISTAKNEKRAQVTIVPFRPYPNVDTKYVVIHSLSCLLSPFVVPSDGPISDWIYKYHQTAETKPEVLFLISLLDCPSERIKSKKFINFSVLVREIMRKTSNENGQILIESRSVPRAIPEAPDLQTFQETQKKIVCFLPVFTGNWNICESYRVKDVTYKFYGAMDDHGVAFVRRDETTVWHLSGSVELSKMDFNALSQKVFSTAFYVEEKFLEEKFVQKGGLIICRSSPNVQ